MVFRSFDCLKIFCVVYVVVVELAGPTAFDLWFCGCDRAVAEARCRPSPRALPAPQPPAPPPPRCMPTRLSTLYSSDTSIQTLKILGSWMYALAYVNCDSFSFPFLVGPCRREPLTAARRRDRVYIFPHSLDRYHCSRFFEYLFYQMFK